MGTNIQVEKIKLISWLTTVNDIDLIKELKGIMTRSSSNNELYELSEEERQSIERGIEDFEKGRVVSHEEAKKVYEKWL